MKPAAEDIVIQPILSERSIRHRRRHNKVAFRVAKTANKPEIKKAVEKLFSVTVRKVNITIVPGKFQRAGYRAQTGGHLPDWKKAVITLAPGDKIDFFEGT